VVRSVAPEARVQRGGVLLQPSGLLQRAQLPGLCLQRHLQSLFLLAHSPTAVLRSSNFWSDLDFREAVVRQPQKICTQKFVP